MRKILILLFLFVSGISFAQSQTNTTVTTDYSAYSSYASLQNPLPKKYVYNDLVDEYIAVNESQDFSPVKYNDMPSTTDVTGHWMGTSKTHTFQFMNRKFESTHIYDLNGVLRSSNVSFQLWKSKKDK